MRLFSTPAHLPRGAVATLLFPLVATALAVGEVTDAAYEVRLFWPACPWACPCGPLSFPNQCDYDWQSPDAQFSFSGLTSGGNRPMADVQVATEGFHTHPPTGVARVDYAVIVVSNAQPPPASQVPVHALVRGVAEATSTNPPNCVAHARAYMNIGTTTWTIEAHAPGEPYAELIFTANLQMVPGTPLPVWVAGWVNAASDNDCSAEAQAIADPEFSIDPTFPFADQFHLEFSPNLDALFIDGFATGTTEHWSEVAP